MSSASAVGPLCCAENGRFLWWLFAVRCVRWCQWQRLACRITGQMCRWRAALRSVVTLPVAVRRFLSGQGALLAFSARSTQSVCAGWMPLWQRNTRPASWSACAPAWSAALWPAGIAPAARAAKSAAHPTRNNGPA